MIVRYVRHMGHPVACVVAIDNGVVGWSKCHPKDAFSKVDAKIVAAGRAKRGTNKDLPTGRVKVYDPELGLYFESSLKKELEDLIEHVTEKSRTYNWSGNRG